MKSFNGRGHNQFKRSCRAGANASESIMLSELIVAPSNLKSPRLVVESNFQSNALTEVLLVTLIAMPIKLVSACLPLCS